ncbi:MAG: amidohydrolase family protein [Planctomycetales bacterium]|nr:amidohydrolase family protein [Planctomycetales bacterium]
MSLSERNRREFLQTAAVGSCAVAGMLHTSLLAQPVAGAESDAIPIIDTHQHLWDLKTWDPPWLQTADPVLRARYTLDEYHQATAGLNVTQAVYMEIDVAPALHVAEAEAITRLCQQPGSPTVAAVISGRPGEAGFAAYIDRFRDNRYIKGLRQVLHAQAPRGLCLTDQFVRSVQHLGELGMSFDICMRPAELSDAVELARRCPHTNFILDHCGNGDPKAFMKSPPADEPPQHTVDSWRREIGRLAEQPNTSCKISGIIAAAPKSGWNVEMLAPIVNHCLDEFGPDRVVFGSDWPVCRLRANYRDWVTALRQIVADRPKDQQEKLWHGNAPRIYRLT